MKLYLIPAFLILAVSSFSQDKKNDDFIMWSATQKLSLNDFAIKIGGSKAMSSYAQFSMDYQLNGFNFLSKNFNKKVHNYIIKSASWIDTGVNTNSSLRYVQTLFDICEIYTRHFRRDLKENKKKILGGMDFAKELCANSMSDFSKRRLEYDKETDYGNNHEKQKQWEIQIQLELQELKDFAFEK